MHNTYDHTVFMIGVLESPTPVTIFHVSNKQMSSSLVIRPPRLTARLLHSLCMEACSECFLIAFIPIGTEVPYDG